VQDIVALLPLLAIALVFWFLIIRPQSRRNRELLAMQGDLQAGDEVMLTSGFYGTLTAVEDDVVHVALGPGTTVKVAKGAIGQKVETAPEGSTDTPDSTGKDAH